MNEQMYYYHRLRRWTFLLIFLLFHACASTKNAVSVPEPQISEAKDTEDTEAKTEPEIEVEEEPEPPEPLPPPETSNTVIEEPMPAPDIPEEPKPAEPEPVVEETPEPVPPPQINEPEIEVEEEPEPVPPPQVPEQETNILNLGQYLNNLGDAVQQALDAADAVGASFLDPELMQQAQENFQQGQDTANTDEQRWQFLLDAMKQAQEAYRNTLQISEEDLLEALGDVGPELAHCMAEQLNKLNSPLYMPEDDTRARDSLAVLREEPDQNMPVNGHRYRHAIRTAKAVVDALSQNLAWLDQLQQEVEKLKSRSERRRLRGPAVQQKALADENYEAAQKAKDNGQLLESETNLFQARSAYRKSLGQTITTAQVERRIKLLGNGLKNSAQYASIGSDGTEYPATEWKGETFLEGNPLKTLNDEDLDNKDIVPTSRLVEPEYPQDLPDESASEKEQPNDSEDAPPEEELEGVTEDEGSDVETEAKTENTESLSANPTPPEIYYKAVETWQQAITQYNNQDINGALEQLAEGERLLEEYRSLYAIMQYYVVRENIDSLWVISGYAVVYNNPFLWRRIYNRNTDIIDVPRLIYPGQRLLIPPPPLSR